MSQARTVLRALSALGTSNYDDLEDETKIERNKLRWACNNLRAEGHVKQAEDALTKEVAWQITPFGRAHLAKLNAETVKPAAPHKSSQSKAATPKQAARQRPKKQHQSDTPAAGGANNSRSRASVTSVGQEAPPSEGEANVIEAATRDKTPAAPAADQTIHLRYMVADSYLVFDDEMEAMQHAASKSLLDNDLVAVACATSICEVRTSQHWHKV